MKQLSANVRFLEMSEVCIVYATFIALSLTGCVHAQSEVPAAMAWEELQRE